MIQAMLLKKLADTVIKKVMDNRELKKIQEHDRRIKKLEKLAHAKAEYVCTTCGCKAKRVKKTKNKSRRK